MLKQLILKDLQMLLRLFRSILIKLQIQLVASNTKKWHKSSIQVNKSNLKMLRSL